MAGLPSRLTMIPHTVAALTKESSLSSPSLPLSGLHAINEKANYLFLSPEKIKIQA